MPLEVERAVRRATSSALSTATARAPSNLRELRSLVASTARAHEQSRIGTRGATEMGRLAKGAALNAALAVAGAAGAMVGAGWGAFSAVLGGLGATVVGTVLWLGLATFSSADRAPGLRGTLRWLTPWWILVALQAGLAFALANVAVALFVAGAGLVLSFAVARRSAVLPSGHELPSGHGLAPRELEVAELPQDLWDALSSLPTSLPHTLETELDEIVQSHRKTRDALTAIPSPGPSVVDVESLRHTADRALIAAVEQARRIVKLEDLGSHDDADLTKARDAARQRLADFGSALSDLRRSALSLVEGGGASELAEVRSRTDELAAMVSAENELSRHGL